MTWEPKNKLDDEDVEVSDDDEKDPRDDDKQGKYSLFLLFLKGRIEPLSLVHNGAEKEKRKEQEIDIFPFSLVFFCGGNACCVAAAPLRLFAKKEGEGKRREILRDISLVLFQEEETRREKTTFRRPPSPGFCRNIFPTNVHTHIRFPAQIHFRSRTCSTNDSVLLFSPPLRPPEGRNTFIDGREG